MSKQPKCQLVAKVNEMHIAVDGNKIAKWPRSTKKWRIVEAGYSVSSNGLSEIKVYFDGKYIGTAEPTSQRKRPKA